jgi:DNA-directed RNA polymerase subunit RPC12/RpoP
LGKRGDGYCSSGTYLNVIDKHDDDTSPFRSITEVERQCPDCGHVSSTQIREAYHCVKLENENQKIRVPVAEKPCPSCGERLLLKTRQILYPVVLVIVSVNMSSKPPQHVILENKVYNLRVTVWGNINTHFVACVQKDESWYQYDDLMKKGKLEKCDGKPLDRTYNKLDTLYYTE